VDKNAYLGSRRKPVKNIARNDRLNGIGCIGIIICDMTEIIDVNIPVMINFFVVICLAVDIIIFCLLSVDFV
jgi:hypothetical protein